MGRAQSELITTSCAPGWVSTVTSRPRFVARSSQSTVRPSSLTSRTVLPAGSTVRDVKLDGRTVDWDERATNRGLEVTVDTQPGAHEVVISSD